jgi:hypothetical protein
MNELSVSINLQQYATCESEPLGEALSAFAEAQQLRRLCERMLCPGTLPGYGARPTSQLGQALNAAVEARRLKDARMSSIGAPRCG